ncbi:MAG: PAS domain-containing protein [Clostridia bacterium]|nr:PAS domain-containing protein [Clostridia bacterium]
MGEAYDLKNGILENMPFGVMYINARGVIEYANGAACALFYAEADALCGRHFEAVFSDDGPEGLSRALFDAAAEGISFSERRALYKNGDAFEKLILTSSGRDKSGGAAVFLKRARSVSAKESAMVYINALNEQLESRNRLLSETFGRFISDEVVKSLLETPEGLRLGGKKCRITLLMSDLRGFTALSEGMEAEDVLSMLNSYLGAMVDIIYKHGGTIIEFIGDSVFAIFGAPAPCGDHETKAVACAIGMQREMARVNEYNRAHGYPPLEMGIGINTGEVIVGNIGSDKRMKFGVVGRHVNLCGRIESYSVGGQILVSPDTFAALTSKADISDTLTVSPKGVKRPITLYSVDGLGAPYNVSCRDENRPVPRRLLKPVAFEANILSGKYIAPDAVNAEFTELSPIEAVITVDTELRPMDNLRLSKTSGGEVVFEEVFAKVIKRTENGYLIHFTASNKAFAAFLRTLLL